MARFGESDEITVDAVVNAASFGAQGLARATEGYPETRVPRLVLAKGNYFGCTGRPAFSRLIYPAPVEGGFGIHLTLDLAGRMRFGPDVEWIDAPITRSIPAAARCSRRDPPLLARASRRRAGARLCRHPPEAVRPGEGAADFLIDGPAEHGLPGLVHLFGIESPGLTSSLSLAEDVADRLGA